MNETKSEYVELCPTCSGTGVRNVMPSGTTECSPCEGGGRVVVKTVVTREPYHGKRATGATD